MEIIQFILDVFENQDALFRFALIILMALYVLFALIVAIQIRNLNRIINQIDFSPIFIFLAFAHATLAIGLLLFTVLFL